MSSSSIAHVVDRFVGGDRRQQSVSQQAATSRVTESQQPPHNSTATTSQPALSSDRGSDRRQQSVSQQAATSRVTESQQPPHNSTATTPQPTVSDARVDRPGGGDRGSDRRQQSVSQQAATSRVSGLVQSRLRNPFSATAPVALNVRDVAGSKEQQSGRARDENRDADESVSVVEASPSPRPNESTSPRSPSETEMLAKRPRRYSDVANQASRLPLQPARTFPITPTPALGSQTNATFAPRSAGSSSAPRVALQKRAQGTLLGFLSSLPSAPVTPK